MVGAVVLAPFAEMSDGPRRMARLAATALALAAWVAVGAFIHDWTGSDYAFAGVVSVIALIAAARISKQKPAAEGERGESASATSGP
jgi:hypothetical protein